MTQINISDLTEHSKEELAAFIAAQQDPMFEIIIPRNVINKRLAENTMDDMRQFEFCAYAGYCLEQVSEEFCAEPCAPLRPDSIIFRLRVTDKEKFADRFYYVINGLHHQGYDDHEQKFIRDLCIFMRKARAFEIEYGTDQLMAYADHVFIQSDTFRNLAQGAFKIPPPSTNLQDDQ